ncbi:MAG TPA: FtsX-like permease family protein [Bryobacteraceae bacterium]|nr:FtsX-like permease family protein [Bryobacteraceae bacterium]
MRAQGRPEALIGDIRTAVHAENADLAVSDVTTLAQEVDHSLREEKLLARLAGTFGVLALLLAAIGLYGVISYSVARRTNEIGIRMALGALPASILREVLGESLVVVVFGIGGRFASSAGLRPTHFKPALWSEGGRSSSGRRRCNGIDIGRRHRRFTTRTPRRVARSSHGAAGRVSGSRVAVRLG